MAQPRKQQQAERVAVIIDIASREASRAARAPRAVASAGNQAHLARGWRNDKGKCRRAAILSNRNIGAKIIAPGRRQADSVVMLLCPILAVENAARMSNTTNNQNSIATNKEM